jgi:Spy/CpxP family protein refolding chaperone
MIASPFSLADDFAQQLVLPSTIHQNLDSLEIPEADYQEMVAVMSRSETELKPLVSKQQSLKGELDELLSSERLDPEKIQAAAERLFDTEKEIRLSQLKTRAKINSYLSAEQRSALLRQQAQSPEIRQQFEKKAQMIQRHISQQNFPAEMRSRIAPKLQKAIQTFQSKQPKEAFLILEEITDTLSGKDTPGKTPTAQKSKQTPPSAPTDKPLPAPESIASFDELNESVDSLRIESIAWRRVEWKHCILEGLKASQEENKPILFWCHIDLPADDKRC